MFFLIYFFFEGDINIFLKEFCYLRSNYNIYNKSKIVFMFVYIYVQFCVYICVFEGK